MFVHIRLPLEFGVLYLSDPYVEDEVPAGIGDKAVTATGTCVAFEVADYEESDADVKIASMPPTDMIKIFHGDISTPNKTIALTDSRRIIYIMLPVKYDTTCVEIFRCKIDGLSAYVFIDNIVTF